MSSAASPSSRVRTPGLLLVLVGIVLLAFNLRPAAVSVGPVLEEVTGALGMSTQVASLLTTLPVLAFAIFGAAAPTAARVLGLHRTALAALALVVLGLGLRASTGSIPLFLAATMLALAGMAMANVLLPSLVKLHFPHRLGRVTAIYTTALALGLTGALMLTVPLSSGWGGWRGGLGFWAGAAAVALLPWLFLTGRDRGAAASGAPREISVRQVATTPTGRRMAVLFGLQSMQAYVLFGWFAQVWRDSGFGAAQAGALIGVLAAVSIPLSLWLPTLAAGRTDQRALLRVLLACYPLGYLGMLFAPHALALVWAVVIGVGASIFPVVLTLIGMRARSPQGTAALSSFTQSVGYLIAATGPLGFGLIHAATGTWSTPLIVLALLTLPMFWYAEKLGRPSYVEDELAGRDLTPR